MTLSDLNNQITEEINENIQNPRIAIELILDRIIFFCNERRIEIRKEQLAKLISL